jgi:hypothetical protein
MPRSVRLTIAATSVLREICEFQGAAELDADQE